MSFYDLMPWRGKSVEPTTDRYAENHSLVTNDPFTRISREMDRVFEGFLGDFWNGGRWSNFATPAIEVEEKDQEIHVRAELPGVDPKDLDVSVAGDTLTLTGKKEQRSERNENGVKHSECWYGSFRREVVLPASVDPKAVSAEYNHGVLTVKLAKTPASASHRIAVKVSTN